MNYIFQSLYLINNITWKNSFYNYFIFRITCINQTKNNTRTTFLSTQGCKTVKENISCLFGAKQVSIKEYLIYLVILKYNNFV